MKLPFSRLKLHYKDEIESILKEVGNTGFFGQHIKDLDNEELLLVIHFYMQKLKEKERYNDKLERDNMELLFSHIKKQ